MQQRSASTAPANTVAAEQASRAATLGALLRASREARQLSLDELSQRTRIMVSHIAALEADTLDAVPQTFVRGYARSLAAVLGIEPEFIDRLLPGAKPGAAEAQPNVQGSAMAAAQAKGRRLGFRRGSSWSQGLLGTPDLLLRAATTTTLPLLLLCVIAFAYHAIDSEFDAAREDNLSHRVTQHLPDSLGPLAHEAVAQAPSVIDSTRLTLGGEPANARLAQAGQSTTATTITTTTTPMRAQPLSQPDAQAPDKSLALESKMASQGYLQNASQLAAQRAQANPSNQVNPARQAHSAPAGVDTTLPQRSIASRASRSVVPNANMHDMHEPVGPGAVEMISALPVADRLVIDVYEDSWIDIRDGDGNRLYRNLARAGRRIDVSGRLPFSLHLGNAPALEIELNGERIPITRYRADNSARLTLASN